MQEGWIVKPRNMTQGGVDNLGMANHQAQLQPIMTVVRHTRRHSSYLLFCRLIPELRRQHKDKDKYKDKDIVRGANISEG